MPIILADPVDEEKGEDSCNGGDLEVDSSRIGA